MYKLQIDVSRQIGGMTFSLAPDSKNRVKQLFPNAVAANSLYVAYDVQSAFEWQHGPVLQHVCPALIGASEQEIFKFIDEIVFVDPVKRETLDRVTKAA